MNQFYLTVNGQTLTFSEGQIPEVQSAFEEAVKKPGEQVVRVSQFGETRVRMENASHMVNDNVQLTDC